MKHVVVSEDQRLLRQSAEKFLRDRYSFARREAIRHSQSGYDPDVWKQMAQLGWLGLPFPESVGGVGGSMLDVELLAETCGPALLTEPLMPTIAGAMAVVAGGTEARRRSIIARVSDGSIRLALAFAERASGYDHTCPSTHAVVQGNGFRIDGAKAVVLGAPMADYVIVSAQDAERGGMSLFLLPADTPGISLRSYATIDGQRAAEVTLHAVSVGQDALLGPAGGGLPVLQRAIDCGTICLLGEAAGIAQAALDLTAHHLNTREQFGRKLAAFQALRHRVAHMYIGKEELRALCRQAAAAFDDDPDSIDTRNMIAAAKVYVGRVGRHICEEAIQLHGAIAISDEYPVGHYLKRMVAIDHMFGNANYHFDIYAATTPSLAAGHSP